MGDAIRTITIQGYKSIRSLESFNLGNLTVLIGANGAGKSNFVSFFSLIRSMVEENLAPTVATRGGADAFLFLGPKVTNQVVGKLYFGMNGYEFSLAPTTDNGFVITEEVAYFKGDQFPESRTLLGRGERESRLKRRKRLSQS